jgi:molecular chaperone IbpA
VVTLLGGCGYEKLRRVPLFRSTIGFDRLFDIIDQADKADQMPNWPPYNIEKVEENRYQISLAVAGFKPDEIELTQHDRALFVSGRKTEETKDRQYMHRGIAGRAFRQSFDLAEHVRVSGASLENGLLVVDLVREVPDTLKPRRIEIGGLGSSAGQDNQRQIQPAAEKAA